jgi:hypothetical protein
MTCADRVIGKSKARNVAADLGTRMEFLCFLLRDRDGKDGQPFDAVFEAEEMEIRRPTAHRRARTRRPQPDAHPRPWQRH